MLQNKDQEIGHEVTLNDVGVMDAGDQSSNVLRQIWVGASSPERILVVYPPKAVPLSSKGKEQKLSRDFVVSVTGTLKKAPDAAVAEREWHLSKDQLDQLAKTGVYVEAKNVIPQGW
jgi:hypothetical protein